jgi:predicted acylesterase/phospholipase RssA/CRP-like cAMP-binding protein
MADVFAEHGQRIDLADGDVLVREGDTGTDVYRVEQGELVATMAGTAGDVVVDRIGAGEIVGEVTSIVGGRRTATLRADGKCVVVAIDRAGFLRWLDDHPDDGARVAALARRRVDRTLIVSMMSETLGVTDLGIIEALVARCEIRYLTAGELLYQEGAPVDGAYFVLIGRLSASSSGHSARVELGRGDVVGELGLIDPATRSATVRAVRDSTLAVLRTDAFEALAMSSPELTLRVARAVIARTRAPSRPTGRAHTLAVAVTAPVDSDRVLAVLVDEMKLHGSVTLLSSDAVDDELGRAGLAQSAVGDVGAPRVTELLSRAEMWHDHVVLRADAELTSWTQRALAHADRVLVVMSSHPGVDEAERVSDLLAVRRSDPVPQMIALVHGVGVDRPHGTAALRRRFGADDVVHVRDGNDADIGRLARLGTGTGFGVVLSGGGARGFGHLGVIRALREVGVPVDAVAGCSMGSIIAAGVALDLGDDALVQLAERQSHRLLDYTLPVVALLKGARISDSLAATFGGWEIDDLWRRYFCVSTNLTRSCLHVHRSGSLARALRASVAIPGVLPPVPIDGELHVDGGVVNNLPADEMRADDTIGTVIAVDVAPQEGPRVPTDYGLSVSGIRALRTIARRRGTAYPSAPSVLLRSMLAGAVQNQERSVGGDVVDLMIQLDLRGIGLLEFDRLEDAVRDGYADSIDRIRDWWQPRISRRQRSAP